MTIIKDLIPLAIRKKIKHRFEKVLIQKTNNDIIENNTIKNIQKSNSNQTIIFFSPINWGFRFQRPQQLAKELAKFGYRIFYVENDMLISDTCHFPLKVEMIKNNIYTVKLSSTSNYFIYNEVPTSKDVIHLKSALNRLKKLAGLENTTLYVGHPFWTDVVIGTGDDIIYDCMDYHAGFKHYSDIISKKERLLSKNAKCVIVTSEFLYKHIQRFNPNKIIKISNGVDYDNFKGIYKRKINSNNVVIGYFGAIEEWIDDKIIEEILKLDNCTLVMIGKVNNRRMYYLAKKYPNLKLTGEIKYSDLKIFLRSFDICLIPFKINSLTKATNPVKIYEYFTSGKPVLATKLPELTKFKELVYFCNINNLKDNISHAITEPTKIKTIRKKIAKENSWTSKVEILTHKVLNKYI